MSKNTTTDKKQNKNLIGPTDPVVDAEAREKLICARVSLLLNHSFFGNLATRLRIINADEWLGTLATDGRHFYYNSRFVMTLDVKELEFGFGHEILHCVYDHMGRRGNRRPDVWNFANDFCVNNDLVDHNIGRKITTVDILYDRKYKGRSSEEIYDELMEDQPTQEEINKMLEQMLDEHLSGDGEGDGDGEDEGKEGKGRPSLSKEEMDAIRDEFKEAIISAANNETNAGNIPGNVKKMLKDLTEPKMDWRELLNMSLTSSIKDDYTFSRPSRRSWHMDAILPGMNPGEETNIALAIDTSGSISSSMLKEFLSEVQGIMESFTAYKIHLFCFDTKIHNPVDYSNDDINDITEYELGGFGGTDFEPIFDHLKEQEIEVDRLVVMTDGYPFGSWGDPDVVDTLWIIHGSTSIEAPFGITTYFDQ